MPVTETTIQAVGWVLIVLALAVIIFTVSGGWRLPVPKWLAKRIKKD